MKTYSRKKTSDVQEEEVIVDLNDLCRLCMSKENELVSIFGIDDSIPLTLRILACVSLEVVEGDGLPDKICHPCKFQISKFFNFRKKCETSDSKLRHLVKDLSEDEGNEIDFEHEDQEMEESVQEQSNPETQQPKTHVVNQDNIKTEKDLVGVAQVTYIQQPDEAEDPENITLPSEVEFINKNACTLEGDQVKKDMEEDQTDNGSNIFIIDNENQQGLDDNNLDAIADAVKATLASQPELKLSGQIQLKVNNSEGKSTQVEITTEDGSVIIMELMTEDATDLIPPPMPEAEDNKKNNDGELEIFKCPNCPKSFSRRIQLRRHESVHMQQRGFSCGICEKWFPTKSALTRHERIHTGERPFQCEVCQKSFAQKEILFRHLMTHTGQKPYNCPHCPKGFTQKEPLRVHLRTHMTTDDSDIQLHYCSLCPKVFCHASGLSRHLVTHTGKTFKCQECDKIFTDKSSLKRHHRQTGHVG
ncbi:zinc finger protein 2-like [Coccinella septempunctata]|uniref:zinc finger protein 2-like n=1 Tax=Coccinella septempunctata TaxID=41139 RepID=UPI001D08A9DA|nr:zinc finger protein 2-like [Coccinella septempunctata]